MYFFAVRLNVRVMHFSFPSIISLSVLSGTIFMGIGCYLSVIERPYSSTVTESSPKYTTHDIIANMTIYFFSDIWCILRTQLPYASLRFFFFFMENINLLSPPTVHGFFSDDNCTFQKNRTALCSKGPITQFQRYGYHLKSRFCYTSLPRLL